MARQHVQSFMFNYAQYEVGDSAGTKALLKIHYAENKYEVEELGNPISPAFRCELARIATDLLGRKHGVNFVDRVYGTGKQ